MKSIKPVKYPNFVGSMRLRYAELVEIIWHYLPGDVVSNLPEWAGTSYFVLAPRNFYLPRACGQALIASPGYQKHVTKYLKLRAICTVHMKAYKILHVH